LVTAQLGNCALAVVTVASDTSAAPIRILKVVIVVLRMDVMCAEFAQATAAALSSALPAEFFCLQRRM
jgi:hypothetical protein